MCYGVDGLKEMRRLWRRRFRWSDDCKRGTRPSIAGPESYISVFVHVKDR